MAVDEEMERYTMEPIGKAMLKSPWFWVSGTTGVIALLLVASLFLTEAGLPFWTELAESLNPGVDAPDNWALGMTYCINTAIVLLLAGVSCGAFGFWRLFVKKGSNAMPEQEHDTSS